MSATGAISQAAVTQMNFSASLLKKQVQAQGKFIEMIAATVDKERGQNLNILA